MTEKSLRGRLRRLPVDPEKVTVLKLKPGAGRECKSYARIKRVMEEWGQPAPIIVRTTETGWEVIDGAKRLEAAAELGWPNIAAFDLGAISKECAVEVAIILQGARGEADKSNLADALEHLLKEYRGEPDEMARLAALPFRSPNLHKLVRKLRGTLNAPHTRRTTSKVIFKFSVPRDAAPVVDRAVQHVVSEHGCLRDEALELLCADYIAGIVEHGGGKR